MLILLIKETMLMRYLLLVYSDPAVEERPMEEWMAFHNKYGTIGKFQTADRLHDVTSATTVTVKDGKTMTTDGPFAETKEHLGGIYIIACDHLDEAIQIASECPAAKTGKMEVRPIFDMPEA